MTSRPARTLTFRGIHSLFPYLEPHCLNRRSSAVRSSPVSRWTRRSVLSAVAWTLRVPKGSCGFRWSDSTAFRRFDQLCPVVFLISRIQASVSSPEARQGSVRRLARIVRLGSTSMGCPRRIASKSIPGLVTKSGGHTPDRGGRRGPMPLGELPLPVRGGGSAVPSAYPPKRAYNRDSIRP